MCMVTVSIWSKLLASRPPCALHMEKTWSLLIMETTVGMWQLAYTPMLTYLKRPVCFEVFFLWLSLCNYYFYLNSFILSCLPCTWWKFPSAALLHCVCGHMRISWLAVKGTQPHSPCVILVSRSNGHCEIPTPVERITLPLRVCGCTSVCMWTCLTLKEVRL